MSGSDKRKIIEAIEKLPASATLEDAIERLVLLARVERGLAELDAGKGMDHDYDHPVLMLQHLLWHEAYHHGQMKAALKAAGRPVTDQQAGPLTWGVWMRKK